MLERAQKAAEAIRNACGEAEIGLILGSGLADSVSLENEKTILYKDIPEFPLSTAAGHKSEWVTGTLCGKRVCLMKGRFHYYEGYSIEDVVLPIRVMKLLGIKTVILTNAAGGVNLDFQATDLMLISDVINFNGPNPLIGPNEEAFGTRFPDMCNAFTPSLRELAKDCAKDLAISLQEGTYMWFTGPSYETPAEIRMARILGADAVGMSTVPEAIVARHCGMDILGISCISNMAAGIRDYAVCHEEVIANGKKVEEKFASLIKEILKKL